MPHLCAICGVRAATTSDHIPPSSLYPKPRDNDINLNTVPACAICNNGSSQDDEVFKVMIGIDTGEYQRDPQRIINSLAGTVGKNARVANQIFSTKQKVLVNRGRPILQPAIAVTFDFKPYERVITRIVRGLHWTETGRAVAAEAWIQVLPGCQLTKKLASDWMSLMMSLPLKKLNKETFTYRCRIGDDGVHVWGMQFFSRHTTFVMVQEAPAQHVEA